MKKALVLRKVERQVFLNDALESSLLALEAQFKVLNARKKPKGWKDFALAGTIVQAFLNEARINAVGRLRFTGWNPKWPAEKRFHRINQAYFAGADLTQRPFRSIKDVREIRNEFGHAMPDTLPIEREEIVNVAIDATNWDDLRHPIDSRLTRESFICFLEDSTKYWEQLQSAAKIARWDLVSRAHESQTFVRDVGGN